MELFHARLKGKKPVGTCSIETPTPWIIVHSDMILKDIEELESVLKQGL